MDFKKGIRVSLMAVLCCLCVYTLTEYAFPKGYIELIKKQRGRRLIYMTNHSIYLVLASTLLSLLIMVFDFVWLSPLHKILLPLSFSVTGTVSVLFWASYFIDPSLVKSKDHYKKEMRVDVTTNICEHLVPFILAFIGQLGMRLNATASAAISIPVFYAIYFNIIWFYSSENKKWAYPILDSASMPMRVFYIFLCAVLSLFMYGALLFINNLTRKEKLMGSNNGLVKKIGKR